MFDSFDKLGRKRFALPVVVALALVCILGLAIAPILSASPHNVPFAIVSLDEGALPGQSQTNIGETLADSLTSGEGVSGLGAGSTADGDASDNAASSGEGAEDAESAESASSLSGAISFTRLDSEEEVRAALEANEYYGAIIIPKGFTTSMLMSQVGAGSAPEVTVLINQGKNASIASSMQSALTSALMAAGIGANVESVNAFDAGGGIMAPLMMIQMMVMPLILMCMIPSIMLSVISWPRSGQATKKERAVKALVQLAFIAAFSGLVGCLALSIDVIGGGLELPTGQLVALLWLAAFCLMTAVVGMCDLCLPLGALITVAVFALGMSTALMPAEMLPEFWANYICPWAPQAAIGEAARGIIYRGCTVFNVGTTQLLAALGIGLACLVLSIFWTFSLPEKGAKSNTSKAKPAKAEAA